MKVLLLSPQSASGEILRTHILEHGHIVVASLKSKHDLVFQIAQASPHLVVAETDGGEDWSTFLAPHFPDLSVCMVSGDFAVSGSDALRVVDRALAKGVGREIVRKYATSRRAVLQDATLTALGAKKREQASQETWEDDRTPEHKVRLNQLLRGGLTSHAAAKHYHGCVLAQQTALDQEIAYRLVHGSHKALSWSRDLATKWLAVLAHYVPAAELCYLPRAGTASLLIDFVHHKLPVEGCYASYLVLTMQINPSVEMALLDLLEVCFELQSPDELLTLSLRLYGLAKFLQQVATAQIELMDRWLAPDAEELALDHDYVRCEHRNSGIFRDFYQLPRFITFPGPILTALRILRSQPTQTTHPIQIVPFADFWRHYQDAGTDISPLLLASLIQG